MKCCAFLGGGKFVPVGVFSFFFFFFFFFFLFFFFFFFFFFADLARRSFALFGMGTRCAVSARCRARSVCHTRCRAAFSNVISIAFRPGLWRTRAQCSVGLYCASLCLFF